MHRLLLLTLLACGNKQPAPQAPPAAPEVDYSDSAVIGRWVAPPCGPRLFERRLSVRPDGTYTGQDRVSPCPPGDVCAWSGIVNFEGTWTPVPNGATLGEPKADKPDAMGKWLSQLYWDGAVATLSADDGEHCPVHK